MVLRDLISVAATGDIHARARGLLAESASAPIVLVGAGALGRRTAQQLRDAGRAPVAFADNRAPALSVVDALPVVSVETAAARYGRDHLFVVSTFRVTPLLAQLRRLAVAKVHAYGTLYFAYPEVFLPYWCLDSAPAWQENADAIVAAFELLQDERSREEYVAQVKARCGLAFVSGEPPRGSENLASEEYFPPDVYRPNAHECFVDCGAFDGDTFRKLLSRTGGELAAGYAIEPDPGNQAALRRWLESLSPDIAARIHVVGSALGRESGTVRFAATGGVSAQVDPSSEMVIEQRTLDDVLKNATPTIIKLDVEGAEVEVLAGGAETITRARPIVACALYHRCDDLWRIPLALHAMLPGHRFFVRGHAEECWDAAAYAIPSERAMDASPGRLR